MFNKFPFHRILVLFTLFSMSLTACNAAPTLTAPESTSASDSSPAPDFTLTPGPTETPTVVPTATEIPDPTMPLGETGKDAEGTYVKMENGDIARKIEYKNSAGEILYEGWAVEKTQKGGIDLLNITRYEKAAPVKLMIASNVLGGEALASLTSPDNPDVSHDSLMGAVYTALKPRYNIPDGDNDGISDLFDKLGKGVLSLPFITSSGESVEGKLGPDTGFITIVVPYDSLDPATVNGVSEWLDPYSEPRLSFRSTVLGVDKDGNIIGLIASKEPFNELPDKLIRALVLFHPANIIKEEDQTTQGFPNILQHFVQSADAMGAEKVPDIIITRNP